MTRIYLTTASATSSEGWTDLPVGYHAATDLDAQCVVWEAGSPPADAACEAADLRVRGLASPPLGDGPERHGAPGDDGVYAIIR